MKTQRIIQIMKQDGNLVVTPKSLARCRQQKRKQGRTAFPSTRLWLKMCWENGVSPSIALEIIDQQKQEEINQ